MPSRLYMVIDRRRDHSFRVPRPDLSVTLGTPNACNDCHTNSDETPQWAADAVKKWYGDRRPGDPHWAPALAAARAVEPGGDDSLAELMDRPTTPAIVRATALELLAGYPTGRSLDVRRKSIADADPLVRLSAIRALSGHLDRAVVHDLTSRLTDPLRSVRVAAAARLAYVPLELLTGRQRSDFERTLVEFRRAQELSLDHAGGHLTLGALDRQHGNTRQAMEHFQAAIRLEPYMAGARAELANLLQQFGADADEIGRLRREEADLLQRDARLAPDNPEILYQLGLLRYLLGEFDAAQTALTSACELAPQSHAYCMALALLQERRYELTGDERYFNAAVRTLVRLNELVPNDPQARQILQRLRATHDSRTSPPAAAPSANEPSR